MIFINLYIHVHVALEAQFSPYTKSMHKAQKSSIVQKFHSWYGNISLKSSYI